MEQNYTERDIREVLITEEEIQAKVKEVAAQISKDYAGKDLVAICILRGCCIFFSDLMRNVTIPVDMEFMATSSYGNGAQSTGNVSILYDLQTDIKGKSVLIVEDIIDSGLTLDYIKGYLQGRHPKSLRICAILDKPSRRKVQIRADYVGFEVEDKFIVGYGLDFDQHYRNLPYISWLKEQ